jgi:DNA-binding MarR family transcriptional regulator
MPASKRRMVGVEATGWQSHVAGYMVFIYISHMESGTADGQGIEPITGELLSGIGQLTRTLFRAAEFAVPRSYVWALDALAKAPCRVTDLACHIDLTQPRATIILQKLEELGLVERRRCAEDRRAVEACITPAGRDFLEQGRQRAATALVVALRADTDDPERAVTLARDAIGTLVHALAAEGS